MDLLRHQLPKPKPPPASVKNQREIVYLQKQHQSTDDTHVFVFMISAETRNGKPYTLPVQCVPNQSLKVSELHRLIVEEMHKRGMTVVCE